MSFTEVASLTWSARGQDWSASLEVFGASSASNTLKILSGRRRLGDERLNPFNPRLPATLYLKILDEGRTIYDYIKTNDANDIRVTVRKDTSGANVIWHQGLFKKLTGGESVYPDNPVLNLVFNDGVTRLQQVSADQQGRKSLFDVIHTCLQDSHTDLTTRVAIAWRDENIDTTLDRSVALKHDTARQVSAGGSRWDMLIDICKLYNLQFFQEEGKWYVLQRSYRDTTYNYAYREKTQGGATSTGTTDPSVSISGSDWEEQSGENEPVERTWVPPTTYKTTYSFDANEWLNADLVQPRHEFGTTTDEAEGWPFGEPLTNATGTVTHTGTDIKVEPTQNANPENMRFARQWYEIPLLQDSGNKDSFTLTFNGTIDIRETADADRDVAVAEVRLWNADGGEQYSDESGSLSGTQQFVKALNITPPSSGTATRSYTITLGPAIPGGQDEDWALRVRLLAEDTAAPGNNQEIANVVHESVDLVVSEDDKSGEPTEEISYRTNIPGDQETETLNLGGVVEPNRSFAQNVEAPSCGVAYVSSSSTLELLESVEHVERDYTPVNTSMHEMRMRDRLAQHQRQLQRIKGRIEYATVGPGDTIVYDGKDWIITYVDERMLSSKRTIGAVELRDDFSNTANVVIEEG